MQRSIYIRPIGIFEARREASPERSGAACRLPGGRSPSRRSRSSTAARRRSCGASSGLATSWSATGARHALSAADMFEARAARRGRDLPASRSTARASWGSSTSRPTASPTGAALPTLQAAVEHGLRLVEEGADILDIGGEVDAAGRRSGAGGRGAAPRHPGARGAARQDGRPDLGRHPQGRGDAPRRRGRRRHSQRRLGAHARSRGARRRGRIRAARSSSCTPRAIPRP